MPHVTTVSLLPLGNWKHSLFSHKLKCWTPRGQAFSQMGVQASCGRPFIVENRFVFIIMLPYEFFICLSRPCSVFWTATFQILAKSLPGGGGIFWSGTVGLPTILLRPQP